MKNTTGQIFMGRRRTSAANSEIPAICRRVEWVLKHEFGNSITLMAEALRVSHTALSRVINKGQMPSGQMIEGLARLGRVNLQWLLADGEGAVRSSAGTPTCCLPVCDRLLPDAPGRVPELLPPLGIPTASPFRFGEAYWFRVPTDSPLVTRNGERILPGDLLLIEAGEAWTSRASAWAGRLVVLRHPDRAEGLVARVADERDYFAEPTTPVYTLDTFGVFPNADLSSDDGRSDGKSQRSGPKSLGQHFFADHVVGVVLEVRRLLGHSG